MTSGAGPVTGAVPRARVFKPNPSGITAAGALLREGRLVAFPTETVYGLGANAFSEEAVLDIFRVKGRPLTDPLIVHVPSPRQCGDLFALDEASRAAVEHLATAFWPGPLTIVARAAPSLPLAVSAGTGFVGVRCPDHAVACELLASANVPVAAPSANRFGHVSPTTAQHVLDDLGAHDIAVLDAPGCTVGIESTVAKVDVDAREVIVLRRGGVSEAALQASLLQSGTGFTVRAPPQGQAPEPRVAPHDSAQQAPGQLLTHYAPDRPTLLAVLDADSSHAALGSDPSGGSPRTPSLEEAGVALESSVVVDFGARLAESAPRAAAYRDLSPAGDVREASRTLFDVLRWSEAVGGASHVLLVDLLALRVEDEHVGALYDRMFRAASGRRVRFHEGAQ